MGNYIKLNRRIQQWGWYKDSATKDVFIELLLRARYEPGEYRGHKLDVGQSVYGLKEISEVLGLTIQNVRTAIAHLKSTGEITTESTNKFTIVTIANWDKWQSNDDEPTTKPTSKPTNDQQTTNKQLTTNKEGKNVKKDKNIRNIFVHPSVEEVQAYIKEKGYHFDAESFVAFYESNGWKVGRNPMKNWKQACVTWEKRRNGNDRRNAPYSRSGETKHGLHPGAKHGADSREDIEAQRLRERAAKLEAAFARPNTLLDGDI